MTYDLLEESWIPVLYTDGRYDHVGILKALDDAGRIREVAASNPMDRLALLRFLISLAAWVGGTDVASWTEGVRKQRRYFGLLGDGQRFYQVEDAKRRRPITELFQEIPTGNNFRHFKHVTDGQSGLCPACCAMGLLRLPLFCVSGLPQMKAGINGVPPVYAMPCGRTLLDTLLANLPTGRELGKPAWEASTETAGAKAVPLLVGLTTPARRVRLHDPRPQAARCAACGAVCSLIWECEFESAGSLENRNWRDPHVLYQEEKEGRSLRAPDLRTRYFKMDRPWAAAAAELFGRTVPFSHHAQKILLVGFATDKANNVDVWERSWVLRGESKPEARDFFRAWEETSNKLAWRIRARDRFAECSAAITAIRPQVEMRVSDHAAAIALDPGRGLDQERGEYDHLLAAVATSLSPGPTTRAVARRQRIMSAVPRVEPQAGKANKGTKTK